MKLVYLLSLFSLLSINKVLSNTSNSSTNSMENEDSNFSLILIGIFFGIIIIIAFLYYLFTKLLNLING